MFTKKPSKTNKANISTDVAGDFQKLCNPEGIQIYFPMKDIIRIFFPIHGRLWIQNSKFAQFDAANDI